MNYLKMLAITPIILGLTSCGSDDLTEYADPALIATCERVANEIDQQEDNDVFLTAYAGEILVKAASYGCVNEVNYLLKMGADPNSRIYGIYYSLGHAKKNNDKIMIDLLVAAGAKSPQYDRISVQEAQTKARNEEREAKLQAKTAEREAKNQAEKEARDTANAEKAEKESRDTANAEKESRDTANAQKAEKESEAKAKALTDEYKQLEGCAKHDFAISNPIVLVKDPYYRPEKLEEKTFDAFNKEVTDSLRDKCNDAFLAGILVSKEPHRVLYKNGYWDAAWYAWLATADADLVYKVIQQPGYTHMHGDEDITKRLTAQMQKDMPMIDNAQDDKESEIYKKISSLAASPIKEMLDKDEWSRLATQQWYYGFPNISAIASSIAGTAPYMKEEPGMKQFSFKYTVLDQIKGVKGFSCTEEIESLATCSFNSKYMLGSYAGNSQMGTGLLSFVNGNLAEIKVYFPDETLDKDLLDALSGKYEGKFTTTESKAYSSNDRREYALKVHKMATPTIDVVIRTNVKIGESSSLESWGWAPGLARQMAGFQRDDRSDTLTFLNKTTLLEYQAANTRYEKYVKDQKAAEERAEVEKEAAIKKVRLADI